MILPARSIKIAFQSLRSRRQKAERLRLSLIQFWFQVFHVCSLNLLPFFFAVLLTKLFFQIGCVERNLLN